MLHQRIQSHKGRCLTIPQIELYTARSDRLSPRRGAENRVTCAEQLMRNCRQGLLSVCNETLLISVNGDTAATCTIQCHVSVGALRDMRVMGIFTDYTSESIPSTEVTRRALERTETGVSNACLHSQEVLSSTAQQCLLADRKESAIQSVHQQSGLPA